MSMLDSHFSFNKTMGSLFLKWIDGQKKIDPAHNKNKLCVCWSIKQKSSVGVGKIPNEIILQFFDIQ